MDTASWTRHRGRKAGRPNAKRRSPPPIEPQHRQLCSGKQSRRRAYRDKNNDSLALEPAEPSPQDGVCAEQVFPATEAGIVRAGGTREQADTTGIRRMAGVMVIEGDCDRRRYDFSITGFCSRRVDKMGLGFCVGGRRLRENELELFKLRFLRDFNSQMILGGVQGERI